MQRLLLFTNIVKYPIDIPLGHLETMLLSVEITISMFLDFCLNVYDWQFPNELSFSFYGTNNLQKKTVASVFLNVYI